jgi:hypothetical protein
MRLPGSPPRLRPALPALDFQAFMAGLGPLPPLSLAFGMGLNRLPLLLSLASPTAGAILVISDSRSDVDDLLRTVVLSACQLNPPEQVQVDLVGDPCLAAWRDGSLRARLRACQPYNQAAIERVQEWSRLARRAELGRADTPARLLVIDPLAELVSQLDFAERLELHWLMQYGPSLRVRPVAALSYAQAMSLDPDLLRSFRTLVLGKIHTPSAEIPTLPAPLGELADESAAHDFVIHLRGEWTPFRVPRHLS